MNSPRPLRAATTVVLPAVLVAVLAGATSAFGARIGPEPAAPAARAETNPVPFLAYYYIWYDRSSWDRAKSDLPLLGPYSSDDANVARQHVRWAKAAGITGFIVSWKDTPILDRRLELLIQVATEEDFKLAIIYQGLDFDRHPQPAARVATDLRTFQQNYASNPVFDIFGKPLVVFSGTWEFSEADVASITTDLRSSLLILASEKNVAGYQRIQQLVDGDAYYWSSVNPDTFPNYQGKLDEMATAIHARNGLWIAPAAPGYNGTLLGGTAVVDRKDGETLRAEVSAALKSSPDAVGVISWNEFSENSQIEPSNRYADRYLKVLSDINHLPAPPVDLLGSGDGEASPSGVPQDSVPADIGRVIAVVLLVATIVIAPIVIARRGRRARRGPGGGRAGRRAVIDAVTRAVRRVPPAWAVVAGIAVIVVAAGLTAGLAALGGPSPSPTPTTPVETPAPSPTVASSIAPGASAASAGPVTSTVPAGWQPTFPIRAAFYYPWYPEAWKQQGLDPFTRYHPSLGFYDSSSSSVISEQIAAMQYGNISVGIASWWGQGTRTDVRLPTILAATGEAAFRWAVYYEPEGQGDPAPQQIRDDLAYIAAHYASDPAYLRVDGRFVVFAYANSGETCAMADRWAEANTVGAYVVLKVFNGFRTCQHQPDGWHQYGPAAADSSQRGYSYTISPGFAKATEASPRLARDVERWTASIAAMVASDAPWQLITTFNEWGEGTSVESASEWRSASGFGAYLDALHAQGLAGSAPIH